MAKQVQISDNGELVDEDGAPVSTGGTAAGVIFTPAGTIAATDVQAAIEEVATDAADATAALPSVEDGEHVTFTPSGVAPDAILTPVVVGLPRILANRLGSGAIALTTAQTSVLASTVIPAANSIAAGDCITVDAWGTVTNNTGSDATVTFRLRVAATNIINVAVVLPTSATARTWRIQGMYRLVVTTLGGNGSLSISDVTDVTDLIERSEAPAAGESVNLSDWSADALDITVQHSVATAGLTTNCTGGAVFVHYPA